MNMMKRMVLAGVGLLAGVATGISAPVSAESGGGSLQALYQRAQTASGTNVALLKELDVVIATANPETVGRVYLVRGNMFLRSGDDDAALSDFLKVTTLFQKSKALQPEAMYQASILLDKARDPRGAEMRKALINDYPGNEFAVKAAAMPKLTGPSAKPAAEPAPAKKP